MRMIPLFLLSFFSVHQMNAERLHLYMSHESNILTIALQKLAVQLPFSQHNLEDLAHTNTSDAQIILLEKQTDDELIQEFDLSLSELKSEGFQVINGGNRTYLIGGDDRGLMYGILDLRDYLKLVGTLSDYGNQTENPHFSFRAFKFNLPWSSYRTGEPIFQHMRTVKDTVFWDGFLDMMADNRFNALTLWNLHPFTFMIQPKNFPEARQFTGQEFAEWRQFWRTLFRMARDRGIETYVINWNIMTSPGMTATHDVANYGNDLEWHYGFTPADTSRIIVDYMRECISQTINEYPNLTGVGVSIGERMQMPMEDAMQWVRSTFVEGIKQADRPVKFIHRAPFKVEPEIARKYIESYTDISNPIIMEFKFNWSHAHSSPNLAITHGGKIADQYWNPVPSNYQMAWMMRNEDFIMFNWSNTAFIREHMAVNSMQDYVAGYFVGSETYIPAKEFRMRPEVSSNWKYAYEKDWAFLQTWGRLLYDPNLSDTFFIERFENRYGQEVGKPLFEALQLGSKMPLALASFYRGTWDFTLYVEGFLNGGQIYRNYEEAGEAFIQIDEMITHPTLDPRYLNIDDFVNRVLGEKEIKEEEITPLELAAGLEQDAIQILKLSKEISDIQTPDPNNFAIELNDVRSWAHLSLYFASKLRAGVHLDEAIKTKSKAKHEGAIVYLQAASQHWLNLIESCQQYQEVSLLHIRNRKFSWEMYYLRVLKDIEIAQSMWEP